VIYPYNKNQEDALLTFNLFHTLMLTGCWQVSQHERTTYTICCTYRVVSPDDEQ